MISGQSATRIADFSPITEFTGLTDLTNLTAAFLANQQRDRSILHQSQNLQSGQSWATWTGSIVPEFSIVHIKIYRLIQYKMPVYNTLLISFPKTCNKHEDTFIQICYADDVRRFTRQRTINAQCVTQNMVRASHKWRVKRRFGHPR